MKKRKLLETLKELIESNAKLTAENEELWLRVGQAEAEVAPTKEMLHTDEEYENLLADNRTLSQKLAEAEAKILELSNAAEELDVHPSTENTPTPTSDLTNCEKMEEPPAPREQAEQIAPDVSDQIVPNEAQQVTTDKVEQVTHDEAMPTYTNLEALPSAALADWQIDIASKIIGQALILITEFTNEISGSSSINKRDLITLALGKSETFKAETVDAVATCKTPAEAEADGRKRLEELRGYIKALRLSV